MSDLERQLYLSLKALPCRCQYERNAAGVPVWFPSEGNDIERRRIKECSRCVGIREYEARHGGTNV